MSEGFHLSCAESSYSTPEFIKLNIMHISRSFSVKNLMQSKFSVNVFYNVSSYDLFIFLAPVVWLARVKESPEVQALTGWHSDLVVGMSPKGSVQFNVDIKHGEIPKIHTPVSLPQVSTVYLATYKSCHSLGTFCSISLLLLCIKMIHS
jgi:hypothetical protein